MPEQALIQCPSCEKWLHAPCIETQAVEDEEQNVLTKKRSTKKEKSSRSSSNGPIFTAKLIVHDAERMILTITDTRQEEKNRWNVDINCLLCGELIEKAATDLPFDSPLEDAADTTAGADSDAVTSTAAVTPEDEDEEEDSVISKGSDSNLNSEPITSDTATPDPVPVSKPIGENAGASLPS